VETARLVLRPETSEITADIHATNCNAQVMRFISKPWTRPLDEFVRQHEVALARNAKQAWGGVSVRLKRSGRFIGLCWPAPCKLLNGGIGLGYRYLPNAWGYEYATEAASSVVKIGLRRPRLPTIGSIVHPQNVASIRVLQKLRFQHVREVFHEAINGFVQVYELRCPDSDPPQTSV